MSAARSATDVVRDQVRCAWFACSMAATNAASVMVG
jgi:hypothetical protein